MNTKILLLAIFAVYSVNSLAQHCLNNVSTNPNEPFNPTSTFATLNFELFAESKVSISLMDLSGNLFDRFALPENAIGMQRVPMNLSELAAGVYFVQVIVNEQSYVKRIIKQ
jgi:hypothetical protein